MITSVFICENARGCEAEKYLGSKHSGLNWISLILGEKNICVKYSIVCKAIWCVYIPFEVFSLSAWNETQLMKFISLSFFF